VIADFHPDGGDPRYFGLYPALVTNIVDEKPLGRIQVKFPWLGAAGEAVRAWATLLTPYADDKQGLWVLPALDTQVVVAFEAGDVNRPYIVGSCWNGKEKMPDKAEKPNDRRAFRSRAQSLLEFDDTKDASKVTLSMKSGHRLVLDDEAKTVTLRHANGGEIVMDQAGKITIRANDSVDIVALTLNVKCPEANFDNVINCMTLNASIGVVSKSYNTAPGNLW
jgi:uncharacterized protein involved in type VI secretion and phage assembly